MTGISALRVVIGFPYFLSSCFYGSICLIGHDRREPLTGLRFKIIRIGYAIYSWIIVTFISWTRIKYVYHEDYDYSYYLGPDYKKTQKLPKKVSAYVMNH